MKHILILQKKELRKKQNYYENIFNFIEAKNNDGSCKLNKATYSSDLCEKLLEIYALPNSKVYDSFMGTGTTAKVAKNNNRLFIGDELGKEYFNLSIERLNGI